MAQSLPPDTILVAGPVIIENGSVLLNRERKQYGSSLFMFPGGVWQKSDRSLEDTCRREVNEELGIDIKIIRPLRPVIVPRPEHEAQLAILIHYLAERIGEIKPGQETIEWGWYDMRNLPKNCASSVYEMVEEFL